MLFHFYESSLRLSNLKSVFPDLVRPYYKFNMPRERTIKKSPGGLNIHYVNKSV